MKKKPFTVALLALCLLATGTLAYITPIDSWNLRDYYDIIKVNEINGSTCNFTTYEDYEGNTVTDFSTLLDDTDTNASTACSGTTTYLDGEGNCDDISGVYVDVSGDSMTGDLSVDDEINATSIVAMEELKAGKDDTLIGNLLLYGAATGSADGGCAKFYTATDHDTTYDYYAWNIDEDDFSLKQGATTRMTLSGATGGLIFATTDFTNTLGYFDLDNENVNTTGIITGGDFECSDCIASDDIADVDDVDVEADLNTYVDIAGDTLSGSVNVSANATVYLGDSSLYYAGLYVDVLTVDTALTDAQVSNTLTCSDLVAGSSVVADAEVDNDITIASSANITSTAGIRLADSVRIYFGTDDDVSMYFDGTDFIISVA